MMAKTKMKSQAKKDDILGLLDTRFKENMHRHKGLKWEMVHAKLKASSKKLRTLSEMENSGGEPDVVAYDKKADEYVFFDCSPESPAGRRSFCYDGEALKARKEHKPKNAAVDMAKDMGAELLTEAEYRKLQELGDFDMKTSSWVQTPPSVRKLGGALFCDKRYGQVFLYHNGAESYYGVRGFRCSVRV